jgi:hypothetical protein
MFPRTLFAPGTLMGFVISDLTAVGMRSLPAISGCFRLQPGRVEFQAE